MKKLIKIIIIIIFIITLTILYSRYIGTKGLKVNEYKITNSKIISSHNGLKIVHITDIHYKSTVFEKQLDILVNKVNEIKPDIIVLTGDIANTYDETLVKYLSKLEAFLGKYAISGEDDNDFEKIIADSGFINLNNTYETIYYKDLKPIIISGTNDFTNDYNNYSILLIHQPDDIDKINIDNYDLILAGHSHLGQVRLPFIGGLFKYEGAKKYKEAYYKINNTDIYISGGIGTKQKYRLFNKPSINLYRLKET